MNLIPIEEENFHVNFIVHLIIVVQPKKIVLLRIILIVNTETREKTTNKEMIVGLSIVVKLVLN